MRVTLVGIDADGLPASEELVLPADGSTVRSRHQYRALVTRLVPATPPPRYDDVFWTGVAALDAGDFSE